MVKPQLSAEVLQSPCKRFLGTTQEFQKFVQVTVLGAHTTLGRFTSFLLKQNPLVSTLRLQGDQGVKNLVIDLGSIDTKCKVQGFEGSLDISKCVRVSMDEKTNKNSYHLWFKHICSCIVIF